jgi:hypothetical protein
LEHDLFGKPESTFPDHALGERLDGRGDKRNSLPPITSWPQCHDKSDYNSDPEATMFEHDQVLQDLHARLRAEGINPLDPKVQAICEVVNAFYAEKTREVLMRMQDVLSKIDI